MDDIEFTQKLFNKLEDNINHDVLLGKVIWKEVCITINNEVPVEDRRKIIRLKVEKELDKWLI